MIPGHENDDAKPYLEKQVRNVLPDISQAQRSNEPPSASIGYKLGQGELQVVYWKDQAGLTPFNQIDVFDSRATLLHVDNDLNYLYTPGELARFPLVQRGIEGVRSRRRIREKRPKDHSLA